MNPDLQRLIALQLQDLEAKRLREELASVPVRVASAEALLRRGQNLVQAAQEALRKEDALRRRLELDSSTRRDRIARLRRQLDAATSTAQVSALEHEIQFAENEIRSFEDEELTSMERSEQQEQTLASAQASTVQAERSLAEQRDQAERMTADATQRLKTLEAERSALRAAIAESLLAQYDRVAKARGTGVSEALDHKCSACQMMVRPQRWNDLTDRANDEVVFSCETCGRLLYWDPRRDAPVAWEPGQVTEVR